jgi:competence protein comEA helix-hairpin-helix repeat region
MPGRCPARAAADVCKSYILCKIPQNRLHFLGYYAIIKIQQAESEESAMQTTRRLAVLTVLAAVLIAAGALFLIAPVWQPQRPAAAYVPAAVHTAAPEAPTLIDINMATAEELTALPGLGPRKAAALVAYREAHGPFATLADAAAVKGISLRMTESWVGLAAANH